VPKACLKNCLTQFVSKLHSTSRTHNMPLDFWNQHVVEGHSCKIVNTSSWSSFSSRGNIWHLLHVTRAFQKHLLSSNWTFCNNDDMEWCNQANVANLMTWGKKSFEEGCCAFGGRILEELTTKHEPFHSKTHWWHFWDMSEQHFNSFCDHDCHLSWCAMLSMISQAPCEPKSINPSPFPICTLWVHLQMCTTCWWLKWCWSSPSSDSNPFDFWTT